MIFLIAALDNPFRGQVSVGPDFIALVYETLMKPKHPPRNQKGHRNAEAAPRERPAARRAICAAMDLGSFAPTEMLVAARNKFALGPANTLAIPLNCAVNFIADVPLQDDHRTILCSGMRKLFRIRYGPGLKIRFSSMPGSCFLQGDASRLMEGAPVRMIAGFWVEISSLGWRPPSVCKTGI